MAVTDGDRERGFRILMPRETTPGMGYADLTDAAQREVDRIAAALAEEREKARAPFLALAQELATVACDHHATVAGDAYADAADRIMAVLDGTYL